MNSYIGTDRVIENIHQFLSSRTDNLERTNPELYKKIVLDFCRVKNKKYDASVLSEDEILRKQKEAFYNWKRRKNYQIEDLEILFNPETLKADITDIFSENYWDMYCQSNDHTYYRYISYSSIIWLKIYLEEQLKNMELPPEDRKQLIRDLSAGITVPILFHMVTQSFLIVQFSANVRHQELRCQIIGYSLKRMKTEWTEDNEPFLVIPPEDIRTYEQFRGCIEKFKSYCANLTHYDRVSRLGTFIKNHPLQDEYNDYEDYSSIAVTEPVFNMFRSVVKKEVQKPPVRKLRETFDQQRMTAEKEKSDKQK